VFGRESSLRDRRPGLGHGPLTAGRLLQADHFRMRRLLSPPAFIGISRGCSGPAASVEPHRPVVMAGPGRTQAPLSELERNTLAISFGARPSRLASVQNRVIRRGFEPHRQRCLDGTRRGLTGMRGMGVGELRHARILKTRRVLPRRGHLLQTSSVQSGFFIAASERNPYAKNQITTLGQLISAGRAADRSRPS
jgi:hypothetical protein